MTAMLSSKKIATSHSVNQDEPPPTENDENESVEGELYSGEIMIEELLPPPPRSLLPVSGINEADDRPPSQDNQQESVEEDTNELMEWLNDKTASPGPSAPRSSRLHQPA
eukprot:CAMPEP_0201948368 /NCGR_PEP_ID=MMETSP0903-20130614/55425_1 /ASSEMBLY_ACC=CAM_ASM_000552 /TAXON_ID=420261 /ORGANISM="Thalassiosira antarctica, Strain CCMP982" /LENGTH=109 /DNA_ID=CAMNT_0048491547 /DNA_START=366 /DNA_END=696 /DNA_ORIENTATION=+